MCDSTTWAQFIATCVHDQGWHDPQWGLLSLLTSEAYHGVSYYWLIFAGIFLLWGLQGGVFVLRLRLDNDSPLRIGQITGKDLDNPAARNLLADYRFWAFLISTVLMLLWLVIFSNSSQPQNLLDSIGLKGPLAKLSPSGMSLVKYYLGVWWGYGVLWWVVSLLCLYIIWEDPFRYRRYRIVLLHEDDSADVKQVQNGQEAKWELRFPTTLLYGPSYFEPGGNRWSREQQAEWIRVRRECDSAGVGQLRALGEYNMNEGYWMPHIAKTGEGSILIKDEWEFTVGLKDIKYKASRG